MELRLGFEEWLAAIPEFEIAPGETPVVSPGIREYRYLPLVWDPATTRTNGASR